jgi:hypothetical protein
VSGQPADGAAIRSRIAQARAELTTVVENVLWDLGKTGMTAGREILAEISDELDGIEALAGDPDE